MESKTLEACQSQQQSDSIQPAPLVQPRMVEKENGLAARTHDKGEKGSDGKSSESDGAVDSGDSLGEKELDKWNEPRVNIWRSFSCYYSFFNLGATDGAVGALIPYIGPYYNVNYTIISLLFVAPAIGYVMSAILCHRIHVLWGQRGIAILAPAFRLAAYVIVSLHPPYPVVVIGWVLALFGGGLEDSGWNAWMGNMQHANEMLGFLHAAYGLGALLSPIVATALVTRYGLPWYSFLYVMIGAAALNLVLGPWAFWTADGKAFRDAHPKRVEGKPPPRQEERERERGREQRAAGDGESGKEGASGNSDDGGDDGSTEGQDATASTAAVLRNPIVWILAAFLLIYVGSEVTLGGWTPTFMMLVRGAPPFEAGISTTGFWTGLTVGRMVLGFITARVGEKRAVMAYTALALGLHLVFYLVPSTAVSFVAVALEGFFLGPHFPAAVVAATKLLPAHQHVAGIGFAASFGATGACLLPFAVGAIAQARGVQVLMPIALAFLVAMGAAWSLLPSLDGKSKDKKWGKKKEKKKNDGSNNRGGGEVSPSAGKAARFARIAGLKRKILSRLM